MNLPALILGLLSRVASWVPAMAAYLLGRRAARARQMERTIEAHETRRAVEEDNRRDDALTRRERLRRWNREP